MITQFLRVVSIKMGAIITILSTITKKIILFQSTKRYQFIKRQKKKAKIFSPKTWCTKKYEPFCCRFAHVQHTFYRLVKENYNIHIQSQIYFQNIDKQLLSILIHKVYLFFLYNKYLDFSLLIEIKTIKIFVPRIWCTKSFRLSGCTQRIPLNVLSGTLYIL